MYPDKSQHRHLLQQNCSCLGLVRVGLIVFEGLFPIAENMKMVKTVQTPRPVAGHVRARVVVCNRV